MAIFESPAAPRDAQDDQVKTLGKAFALLEAIAKAAYPPTISEIAVAVGISRPTAHRLVQSLLSAGFLERSAVDGRLAIGYGVLPLAASQLDRNRLRIEAIPQLQLLAERMNERVNLGILYRNKVLAIAGVEKPGLPTIYSRFGRAVPVHCCGLGKAILSALPVDAVLAILAAEPLAARTPNTITTPEALLAELALVRARGYATEEQENSPTSCCIAAPILDDQERPVGAVSVSGRALGPLEGRVGELLRAVEMIAHLTSPGLKQAQGGFA